jgi:hypothetical protein
MATSKAETDHRVEVSCVLADGSYVAVADLW